MKIKLLFLFIALFSLQTYAQTVTALQQQNARATGYAIVAARNPGKSFTVLMIKWDGLHDLEYNANTQINSVWHPQAAVKGNYFNQTFEGSDFAMYSSVVVSQAEFDLYKDTGKDWWIVCSVLPAFSNSELTIADNGNVGIGSPTPTAKLEVNGDTKINGILNVSGTNALNFSAFGGGLYMLDTSWIRTYGNKNFYHDTGIMRTDGIFQVGPNGDRLVVNSNGKVGIGSTNPLAKLDVNGDIHAREVRVDLSGWPDYVFQKYYTGKSDLKSDYTLPTLAEIEDFTKKNHHLPNVPSAQEVQQNGVSLGQMSNALLQKVEELTLYAIEQNKELEHLKKENNVQSKEIKTLKKENEMFIYLSKRLTEIENQLK
ncbi:hypothetical protein [Flavobacterium sp. XS2P14]|uniref:hypothetical protein n=1 Tax=Flavobacterium sp. XS2P14 TaxID=3401735 RepID=UPI003AAAD434